MLSQFTLVRAINFKEMPSLQPPPNSNKNDKQSISAVNEPPIIWFQKGDLKRYCRYLLSNIKEMEVEDTEGFVNKLLAQTVRPISWLNNLEKLVNLNLLLLGEKANPLYLTTLHIFIDEKRKELELALEHTDGMNIRRSNGSYSFKKLKYHLNKIDSFCEQKLFLTECKIEYQQFKPKFFEIGRTPFDEIVDLEIQRITIKEEYRKAKKAEQNRSPVPNIQKIKINSQINQFVDIFYRMINEYKIENEPLIITSNANMAKLLAYFFTDSTGVNIEQSTIETYLSKSKPETRPKEYNRIKLS